MNSPFGGEILVISGPLKPLKAYSIPFEGLSAPKGYGLKAWKTIPSSHIAGVSVPFLPFLPFRELRPAWLSKSLEITPPSCFVGPSYGDERSEAQRRPRSLQQSSCPHQHLKLGRRICRSSLCRMPHGMSSSWIRFRTGRKLQLQVSAERKRLGFPACVGPRIIRRHTHKRLIIQERVTLSDLFRSFQLVNGATPAAIQCYSYTVIGSTVLCCILRLLRIVLRRKPEPAAHRSSSWTRTVAQKNHPQR